MTLIGPIESEELRWTTDQLHNVLLLKEYAYRKLRQSEDLAIDPDKCHRLIWSKEEKIITKKEVFNKCTMYSGFV